MKYIFLIIILGGLLPAQAQLPPKVQVDMQLVKYPKGLTGEVHSVSKKRRSVWRCKYPKSGRLKIVSRPFKKITKVKTRRIEGELKYEVKYFVIDGKLTSYRLRAENVYGSDIASLFGIEGLVLEIDIQQVNGGYVGASKITRMKTNRIYSESYVLVYPTLPSSILVDRKLFLLLPVLSFR